MRFPLSGRFTPLAAKSKSDRSCMEGIFPENDFVEALEHWAVSVGMTELLDELNAHITYVQIRPDKDICLSEGWK